MMTDLFGNEEWTHRDTRSWLDDHPLPQGFAWEDRPVAPQKRIHHGYGFWLQTTPYHPGLFEAIHRFLAAAVYMPTPEEVWQHLRDVQKAKKSQSQLHFEAKNT